MYNFSGLIKLSFCLLMNGLSLRIVSASYMKSLFVSLNYLTGHVFCWRSSKVEFCCCLSLKCSLIAPSLQCCSSLLLIVFLVMPMYEDVRSSQSSCGQVNLYRDHDLERGSLLFEAMLFFIMRSLVLIFR